MANLHGIRHVTTAVGSRYSVAQPTITNTATLVLDQASDRLSVVLGAVGTYTMSFLGSDPTLTFSQGLLLDPAGAISTLPITRSPNAKMYVTTDTASEAMVVATELV